MKKVLFAVVSALLVAVMAVSAVACSGGTKVKVIEIDLSAEDYGIAIEKGNTELKTQIDEIVNDLIGDGVDVDGKKVKFNDIYLEEMEAFENGEFLSIGEVATESTNRDNELVVATNAEFAPFEYISGESFGGIDMQVAKIIADKMGKTLVIKHMAFESVIGSITTGMADIGMAAMTISADRLEEVDFSVPYCKTAQRIAVAADDTRFDECKTAEDVNNVLKGLSGVKAGGATGQTGLYYLQGSEDFGFEGFANLEIQQFTKVSNAVQALVSGNIEIVCADRDTLKVATDGVNR